MLKEPAMALSVRSPYSPYSLNEELSATSGKDGNHAPERVFKALDV